MNKREKPYIIAVDFDGTLCKNRYPEIGEPKTGMIKYLKKRQNNGAKLILWTCRVGQYLADAVDWCRKQGLAFDAVNENLSEIVAEFGSDTRKIFANEYIDDRNMSFRGMIMIHVDDLCGGLLLPIFRCCGEDED